MGQKIGKRVRGKMRQIAIHLARLLNETVAGYGPDHQENRNLNLIHWWHEIQNWAQQIEHEELTNRQLLRELRKEFTAGELQEIRGAMQHAAKMMNEEPPNINEGGFYG